MLNRILRGHYHERLRQRIGMRVDRDLAFIHCFQQRGLCLGRGAVNLVRKKDVGEHRPRLNSNFCSTAE